MRFEAILAQIKDIRHFVVKIEHKMREKSVVAAISLSARTSLNSQPLFVGVKIVTLFPLSIAASEQESWFSVCIHFPFVIVVVEMWCEYIRACTARTHLL